MATTISEVKLLDPVTGKELSSTGTFGGYCSALCFSPDGALLAVAHYEHTPGMEPVFTMTLWDVENRRSVGEWHGHRAVVEHLAFSPDGRLLASGDEVGVIKVWDVPRRQEAFALRGHTWGIRGLDFSRDGRRLASVSKDHTVRLWDVTPAGASGP